ncbi:hypothetical protein PsorP6_006709 [Peronosclerospora sorghi]|uniref:Uncharacterized protein n=1 Tax=Peronosclerospora sorghi TaxID=230839 RepID=A0ACC0W378_9STRA|nr:hypothetical protein PsorP6_006709 [Peronosclerospora sorghi]
MSAAEKRAARRARVLQGSERRLKLLSGQISSVEIPTDDLSAKAMKTRLVGSGERLDQDSNSEASPTSTKSQKEELQIPTRVDPAQRRRDAAERRRRKEKMVQEVLNRKTDADGGWEMTNETGVEAKAVSADGKNDPTCSRHLTSLRLSTLEEKLVLLLIIAAAVYCGAHMDLSSIYADMVAKDPIFVNYQDLITKGIPIESIRQQLEREHMLPETREKMELSLRLQLKMEALGTTSGRSGAGWIPDVSDPGFFISSLMTHPPIVFGVFLVRLIVSYGTKVMHKVLHLPKVKNPQENDLGFLPNMALSSRPMLKDFLVKGRKSFDDVFVFIFVLVIFVAVRASWKQW